MRIRFNKGVALFATIAGAAVATAFIVYNIHQGNGHNVSDMEQLGLLGGLSEEVENALDDNDTPVVADSNSGDAAAFAGVIGDVIGDNTHSGSDVSDEEAPAVTPSEAQDNTGAYDGNTGGQDQNASLNPGEETTAEPAPSLQSGRGTLTYTEVIPRDHTETVVEERVVTVERPVTVVDEVTEVTDADPVYFYQQSGKAASGELTTSRRQEELEAAKRADEERLKIAAQNRGDIDWKVPDEDYTGDMYAEFY